MKRDERQNSTQSVAAGIPTQSVGTRNTSVSRSHALRGNACSDALRRAQYTKKFLAWPNLALFQLAQRKERIHCQYTVINEQSNWIINN
ncbi:hypothetical protein THIOM_000875 [Candidatus Thiomargarita nelsonii]|uniref:Uncharacterized protein n=1 Tax=Candidatus Thiomargarita nelsonii TaxID=1003181 RepID=A0A176S5Q6_9GAMM|nr:hypothetical protein THIOM_000875 [Candidatus Thiomargarita nelsonii]